MANAPANTDEVRAAAPGELIPLDDAPPQRANVIGRRGFEGHAIALVGSITILVLAMLMSVHGEERVDLPVGNFTLPALCHVKRLTGMDCPGCGLTRCFISLAHGDLVRAWHYNPAGLLVFGLVVIQIPYQLFQLWRWGQGLPKWQPQRLTNVVTAIVVTALLLQWFWKLLGMTLAWNE